MAQPLVSLYEGLFLLNQQEVTADFKATGEHLQEIFNRAKAEVVAMKKWAERRLAYAIKGQKRGTFILVYFRAEHGQIARIERDCNLSEKVIRSLIIRADHIGDTELEVIQKDSELSLEVKLHSELSNPVAVSATADA